jgi:hypothetical protein
MPPSNPSNPDIHEVDSEILALVTQATQASNTLPEQSLDPYSAVAGEYNSMIAEANASIIHTLAEDDTALLVDLTQDDIDSDIEADWSDIADEAYPDQTLTHVGVTETKTGAEAFLITQDPKTGTHTITFVRAGEEVETQGGIPYSQIEFASFDPSSQRFTLITNGDSSDLVTALQDLSKKVTERVQSEEELQAADEETFKERFYQTF